LILSHHDHNNLAKEDNQVVKKLEELRQFVLQPTSVSYKKFEELWPLFESVISRGREAGSNAQDLPERREDFPLLILHGFADSLASRGLHCPISLGLRSEIYLVFLAIWQCRDPLTSLWREWSLCRARTTKKVNPDLHEIVFSGGGVTPDRQQLLGQLPEWGWGRVQSDGKCPEPEEFVEEARRRFGEMASSMLTPGASESPVPGGAGSP